MAIYQGRPLPRKGTAHARPRLAAPSPRVPDRPPVPVRILSRPATPLHGLTTPPITLPRDRPAQHAVRLRVVSGPRSRTALAGVAVILAITFVGLFYLSQTFAAAAARYEVQQLLGERQVMLRELQTQQGVTRGLGSGSTVTQWAQGQNLDPLRPPLSVTTR